MQDQGRDLLLPAAMKPARPEKFRILVVGDVNSGCQAAKREVVRPQRAPRRIEDASQFGGAANIARMAAGLGAMVGFLLLSQGDTVTRACQIAHFHVLLPQYHVVVFSEYRHCAPMDLDDMVASARSMGKRVLVDLDGSEFGLFTGASLLASDVGTLRRLIGTWRSEGELTNKMARLLSGAQCEGFLVNRHEAGISLYLSGGPVHFANMIRCDRYYLLAVIAANLKADVSIPLGVSEASNRFDPMAVGSELDIPRQEMMLS